MARRPRDPLDLHGHHIVTSDELHRAFDRDEEERQRARHRRRLLHGLVLIAVSIVVAAGLVLVLAISQGYRPFSAAASPPSSSAPRPTLDARGCPVGDIMPVPADRVRVDVFNATTTAGLAASVASRLRERGYAVGSVGNRTVEDRSPVVVVAGPQGRAEALTVQRQLPGSVYREDRREGTGVDVVLGTAFTRLADVPAATAAKAGRLRCAG